MMAQDSQESSSSSDGSFTLPESGIFEGLTAWFSSSVKQQLKQKWVDNQGDVVDFESAMYIFSANAAAEDTSRIYKTQAYLSEHLAVFHPYFIEECLRQGDCKKVAVGEYFMPPVELHAMINNQMDFRWEKSRSEQMQNKTPSRKTPTEAATSPKVTKNLTTLSPKHTRPALPVQNDDTSHTSDISSGVEGHINISSLRLNGPPLQDFVVGQNGCRVSYWS